LNVIRLYIIGILILLGAILANLLASKLNIKSWYDLLQGLSQNTSYWNEVNLKDGIWLLVFYPLLLGLSAYTGNLIHQKLF